MRQRNGEGHATGRPRMRCSPLRGEANRGRSADEGSGEGAPAQAEPATAAGSAGGQIRAGMRPVCRHRNSIMTGAPGKIKLKYVAIEIQYRSSIEANTTEGRGCCEARPRREWPIEISNRGFFISNRRPFPPRQGAQNAAYEASGGQRFFRIEPGAYHASKVTESPTRRE